MDAPKGMNEREADRALRDLFREVGDLHAPEGLDARILQRIAVLPQPALLPERPLLPKWTWLIAAGLATGLALYPGFDLRLPEMHGWGAINWGPVLHSPWLLMGLGACVALLGLDAWLNRRRGSHATL